MIKNKKVQSGLFITAQVTQKSYQLGSSRKLGFITAQVTQKIDD